MTETNDSATIAVAASATSLQVKAQVRLGLAALAGALVGKHIIPAGIINNDLLDALSALVMIGVASAWQYARVRLVHSRFWSLALNKRVPDDLVKPVQP